MLQSRKTNKLLSLPPPAEPSIASALPFSSSASMALDELLSDHAPFFTRYTAEAKQPSTRTKAVTIPIYPIKLLHILVASAINTGDYDHATKTTLSENLFPLTLRYVVTPDNDIYFTRAGIANTRTLEHSEMSPEMIAAGHINVVAEVAPDSPSVTVTNLKIMHLDHKTTEGDFRFAFSSIRAPIILLILHTELLADEITINKIHSNCLVTHSSISILKADFIALGLHIAIELKRYFTPAKPSTVERLVTVGPPKLKVEHDGPDEHRHRPKKSRRLCITSS